MFSTWAPLQSVLDAGPHYILDDQRIWEGPIEEFRLPCRIVTPLRVELDILPQEEGLLIRGRLSGEVASPCGRCAEDARQRMDFTFDSFEPFPPEEAPAARARKAAPARSRSRKAEPEPEPAADPDVDEFVLRYSPKGLGLEINLGALAWEEFASALDARPLCRDDCAGLCQECGQNLNHGECSCRKEDQDPRLAKLRGLTLVKK
ncbi:DUF177 domain-containing protein [Desulfovibrio sp. OttesenSCG-928-C14]|nr:DUF177 domain-containing protein [Desulfovibrio sp. OttesenSCG-928-C14]